MELMHMARAARRVSQIFRLLFLGNGWTDCAEILYALGAPLVTAYAIVTGGASLHVRTCRDTPTSRFCISETAWPILFEFGMWVGGHSLSAFHKSWVECICTRARAHPFPTNVQLAVTR